MSEIIMGQVRFVLVTLCLGMLLMTGYDIIRFVRWIIPHHKILVGVEDLLYWTAVSVPVFVVFYIYNNGEIRWYGALAVLLGGILYEKGISSVLRRFGRCYLEKPKRKLFGMFGRIIKYFRVKKQERIQKRNKEKEKKEK